MHHQVAARVAQPISEVVANDQVAASLVVDGMIRGLLPCIAYGEGLISIEHITGLVRLYAEATLDAMCRRSSVMISGGEGAITTVIVKKQPGTQFVYTVEAPQGTRRAHLQPR